MKHDRVFLACPTCGNIVGLIEDTGISPLCCGREMTPLTPNVTDASREKHVPQTELENHLLRVQVGSVEHPMTEAHHISWIATAQGAHTQRAALIHTDAPQAAFAVGDGDVTVYAYCNLHGLWAADVPAE